VIRKRTVTVVAMAAVASLLVSVPGAQASPANAGRVSIAVPDDKPGVSDPGQDADIIDASDPGGREAKLNDFKAWLVEQPGIADSGYIESIHDSDAGTAVLLWHGASALQDTAIAYGTAHGIKVSVQQRDYDRRTLEAAANAALDAPDQVPGFHINSAVAINRDYDGVVLWGKPTNSTVSFSQVAARKAAVQVPAVGGGPAIAVRASFVESGPPTPTAATRANDFAPFNAGGFMHDVSSQQTEVKYCSTGFAIRRSGKTYTTTARHCWMHQYKAAAGSASYGDGVVNSGDGAGRQMSTSGSSLMFDGAYNNSTGYTKSVIGYATVAIGSKVCTSGGNSGVHCGIQIDAAGQFWNDGFSRVSTITASQHTTDIHNAGTASAPGDSGGPVFVTAGTGKVRAVGMMQWANFNSPWFTFCDNRRNLTCSKMVGFTLMSVIVNTIPGASLVTN